MVNWIKKCLLTEVISRKTGGRGNFKKVLVNSWWLLVDRILKSLAGIFVVIWIGRYLGPELYGVYNYVFSYTVIFAALASLGIDGILIRDLVRYPEKRDRIMGSAFLMKAAGGIIAFIISAGASFIIGFEDPRVSYFIIIISAGFIFQSFDVISHWFQSRIEFKYIFPIKAAVLILLSLAKVLLIIFGASIELFLYAGLMEIILYAAGFIIIYSARGNSVKRWRVDVGIIKGIFTDSWPLMVSGIGIIIFYRIDQLMLERLRGFSDVGIYNSALKIAEFWNIIPLVIIPSIYPLMVKNRDSGREIFDLMVMKINSVLFVISIAIVALMSLFSREAIVLLFGIDFQDAALPLILLSVSAVFNFSSAVRAQVLMIEKKTIYNVYIAIMGLAFIITLNLILIPPLGIAGAAAANLISCLASGFLSSFIFKKTRAIGILQSKSFIFFWRFLNLRPAKA
jgi:polysaccharide transporter, PST family